VINNRDLNIDQNNRDYHFGPNRAALHWLQFFNFQTFCCCS